MYEVRKVMLRTFSNHHPPGNYISGIATGNYAGPYRRTTVTQVLNNKAVLFVIDETFMQ